MSEPVDGVFSEAKARRWLLVGLVIYAAVLGVIHLTGLTAP